MKRQVQVVTGNHFKSKKLFIELSKPKWFAFFVSRLIEYIFFRHNLLFMKLKWVLIFAILLFFFFSFFLVQKVNRGLGKVNEFNKIKNACYRATITILKAIQDAQFVYKAKKGNYTNDWGILCWTMQTKSFTSRNIPVPDSMHYIPFTKEKFEIHTKY